MYCFNLKVQSLLNLYMFYNVYLDRKRRLLFFQFEKLYIICKFIDKSCFFTKYQKGRVAYIRQELPKNCSIVRLHNFCYDTGRSRGVFKFLGVSRIRLRELISLGLLPGMQSGSW